MFAYENNIKADFKSFLDIVDDETWLPFIMDDRTYKLGLIYKNFITIIQNHPGLIINNWTSGQQIYDEKREGS